MKKKLYCLIGLYSVIVLLAVLPVYGGEPNEPHDANAMWIEPSTIVISTDEYAVGDTFNVTVWVNITSVPSENQVVGCWQFYMIYDKSVLEAINAVYTAGSKSQFFEDINTWASTPSYGHYNETHDYVMFGEMWNPMAPEPNPKKSIPAYGSLATVTFNITSVPPEGQTITTTIDISTEYHPPTSKTYVLDDEGNEVPLTPYNATYIIPEFSFMLLAIAIVLTLIATVAVKLRCLKFSNTQ